MKRFFAFVTILALGIAAVSHADKPARKVDLFWVAPDLASYDVRSIALLPAVTYDNNLEARKMVENVLGQQFKGSGHRWTSGALAREFLLRDGGDSLLKAYSDQVLKNGRPDSADVPRFARAARSRAVLCVRVDQYEKRELEFNESGHATTTVKLRAALIDSTGHLLWTASGGETQEGPYQDAATGTLGVKASGLNTTPVTQGGAPSYNEVLAKIFKRWAEQFPQRAAAAADSTGK